MGDFKMGIRKHFGFNKRFDNREGDRGGFRGGRDRGPSELFDAICSQCKKPCQVPFRPTTGKPIFCNNCFSGKKESNDRFPRRSYEGFRTFSKPEVGRDRSLGNNDEVKKQLELLNEKMDKLIRAVEGVVDKINKV